MDNWREIATFNYPHEAHLAKIKLESEGISVLIRDEFTAQVYHFHSNAIGGVKLLVKDSQNKIAQQVLLDSGIQIESEPKQNRAINKFNDITSKIPWFRTLLLPLRLFIVVGILSFLIIVPFIIKSKPQVDYHLTAHYWCIDKMIINGIDVNPNTTGVTLSFVGICEDNIVFHNDGKVVFPGINSERQTAFWISEEDSIYISSYIQSTSNQIDSDSSFTSSYCGRYKIERNGLDILFQSKNNIIVAHADNEYYRGF